MPKQPPEDKTELAGGQRRRREADQLVRALRAEGPTAQDELSRRVAAVYWDEERFGQALTWAVGKGLISRDANGQLSAS